MNKFYITVFYCIISLGFSFAQCNLYGIEEVYDNQNVLLGNRLVLVDELTGATTPVGNYIEEDDLLDFDISQFNEAENKYYMLTNNVAVSELYMIDVATGIFSSVSLPLSGEFNYMLDIIMDNENQILYGFTADGMLGTINTSTGEFTEIGPIEHLYSYFNDFHYSFYDQFSNKLFMIGQTEYSDRINEYSVFVVDPVTGSADTILAEGMGYLFLDNEDGKVYGVFEAQGALDIKEFNKNTKMFVADFSVNDPYGLVLDASASYNSLTKNLIMTGTTTMDGYDYNGYYVLNLATKDTVVVKAKHSGTDFIQHGGCTVLATSKPWVNEVYYTSPASDALRITLKENITGTINLYGTSGSLIKTQPFSGREGVTSTRELTDGVYYFNISGDQYQSPMQKVVVVK